MYACLPAGAAPGGWSAHLATLAQRVLAVDPAALAPEVLALPNVVHLRCHAADAAADIRLLVPDGVDLMVWRHLPCWFSLWPFRIDQGCKLA